MKEKEIKSAIHQYECSCNLLMCAVNVRFYNGMRDPYWIGGIVGGFADFEDTNVICVHDMWLLLKSKATSKDLEDYFNEIIEDDSCNVTKTIYAFLKEKNLLQ